MGVDDQVDAGDVREQRPPLEVGLRVRDHLAQLGVAEREVQVAGERPHVPRGEELHHLLWRGPLRPRERAVAPVDDEPALEVLEAGEPHEVVASEVLAEVRREAHLAERRRDLPDRRLPGDAVRPPEAGVARAVADERNDVGALPEELVLLVALVLVEEPVLEHPRDQPRVALVSDELRLLRRVEPASGEDLQDVHGGDGTARRLGDGATRSSRGTLRGLSAPVSNTATVVSGPILVS
ncbi:MAG: hypothetical protein KF729_33745 [Sandaracinaceae bacterium]|nr:hypothetical protein [Sandaracinaceae bacterium]